MPLKYKFKTRDEIGFPSPPRDGCPKSGNRFAVRGPVEHLPLYAERDGARVLDVDGAVEKSKLDEFRNTNVSLIKERDELKQRFDGIDPEQARATLTSVRMFASSVSVGVEDRALCHECEDFRDAQLSTTPAAQSLHQPLRSAAAR